MKASTVTTTAQAPTPSPAPVQHLFLTEFTQTTTSQSSDTLDPRELQMRATTITVTLRDILVLPGDYRHFGIND